jgi:hypothetical protein
MVYPHHPLPGSPGGEAIGVRNASVKTAMATRGTPAQPRKFAAWLKPIVAGGLLLTAGSGAYLTLTQLHPPPPNPAPDPRSDLRSDLRTGSIIILAPDLHFCRHLKFDNVTGKTKDEGTGACNDPAASTAARLGEVWDSFKRR